MDNESHKINIKKTEKRGIENDSITYFATYVANKYSWHHKLNHKIIWYKKSGRAMHWLQG
jgi:hypothetical protein